MTDVVAVSGPTAREAWYAKPLKLCVAIGVANPERLEALPGAWAAAHGIAEWAASQGYHPLLITDEDVDGRPNPVTGDRLKAMIIPWVTDLNIDKERLVVAFAGHGAADGMLDLWLLNSWRTEAEQAINVERLKNRMESWGFRQICVIKDACKTGIADTPDIGGTSIVGIGGASTMAEFDILEATRHGQAAYMVYERGTNKPYCLFSQVLLDALHGRLEGSVDPARQAVSTSTLRQAVPPAVREAANSLGKSQDARITPGFAVPNDIYTELVAAEQRGDPIQFGGSVGIPPRRPVRPRAIERKARSAPKASSGNSGPRDALGWQVSVPVARVAPVDPQTYLVERLMGSRSGRSIAGPSIEVVGDTIQAVVSSAGAQSEADLNSRHVYLPGRSGSLAIELGSGLWASASVMHSFRLTLAMDKRGVAGLIYRSIDLEDQEFAVETARAVADLGSGALSDRDMRDLATWVRKGKRADPVRSVIAAAFYARLGDMDNIRRVAWYMHRYSQAIPPDLALLGRFEMVRQDERLLAIVPAAQQRQPEQGAESEAPYTTHATPETVVPVAGITPWLRQSWEMFELVPGKVAAELAELEPFLTRAIFTTLAPEGGQRLAELIKREAV